MSYSQRRGFGDYQINIPIDQVISRDKEATASKVQQLQGNQTFKANQQQLRLASLSNKHAIEEKNRDTNFRFMQDNYDRIHKAETQEFEQRIKDLDKDRHIETFAEKLGPTLLKLAPTLLKAVEGIQKEKDEAKAEFNQNWMIDNKVTTQQKRLIAENVDLLKSKSDAAHKWFEENLRTPEGIKDLDSVLNFIANDGHNSIESQRIGAANSREQIAIQFNQRKFHGADHTFTVNGQTFTGEDRNKSPVVYKAWENSIVRQIPSEYKNAALNEENAKWTARFRGTIAGERGQYLQKKVQQDLKNRFFTGFENARTPQEKVQFYNESILGLDGKVDLITRDQNNKLIEHLVDNDLIASQTLEDMRDTKVPREGVGTKTFRGHMGVQQGRMWDNWLQKARANEQRNINSAESYQQSIYDKNYKQITDQLSTAEGRQTLAAMPSAQVLELGSKIGEKNASNLLSIKLAAQAVPETKTFYKTPVGKAIKPDLEDAITSAMKKIDIDLKTTNPKQYELSTKDGTKIDNYDTAVGFAKLKVEKFLQEYVSNHPEVENDGIELIKAAEEYIDSTLMPQMTPTPPSADGVTRTPDEDRNFNLGLPGGDKTKGGGLGVVKGALYNPENTGKSPEKIVATTNFHNSLTEKVALQKIAGIAKIINQRPLNPNEDLSFITRNKYIQEYARMSGLPVVHAANLQLELNGYEPLREELTLSLDEYNQQSSSIKRLVDNYPEVGLQVIKNQQEGLYDKPGAIPQSADYGGVDFSTNNISSIQKETAGGQSGVDVYFEDGRFPAFANGVVKEIGRQINPDGSGYGNYIVVASNDDETGEPIDVLYSHLQDNSILVKENQQVSLGQQLGTQGGTGSVYSQDGTIASIDVLASAPKGSGSMKPAKNWNRIVDNWINRMKNGTMHIGWQ